MVEISQADRIAAQTVILGKRNDLSTEFTGFADLGKDFLEVPEVVIGNKRVAVVSVRQDDIMKAEGNLNNVPQLAAFKEQFDRAGAKPGDYNFQIGGEGANANETAVAITVDGDLLSRAQSNLRGAKAAAK